MAITYEHPQSFAPDQVDPGAPNADLDQWGRGCGVTTIDSSGVEWRCTRSPHTGEDEHRAAYVMNGDYGPVGEVAIAWTYDFGGDEGDGGSSGLPSRTHSVSVTLTFSDQASHGIDGVAVAADMASVIVERFSVAERDGVQVSTTVRHDVAATRLVLADLIRAASYGRSEFESHVRSGTFTSKDEEVARARWAAVEQLAAQLITHIS